MLCLNLEANDQLYETETAWVSGFCNLPRNTGKTVLRASIVLHVLSKDGDTLFDKHLLYFM